MSIFLHAGCGPATKEQLGWVGDFAGWDEVRLDIDAKYNPDITGDLRDLTTWAVRRPELVNADVLFEPDGYFDGVFCSHVIEHVHPYEVHKILRTFSRVLRDNGLMFLVVPNFQAACIAAARGDGRPLYKLNDNDALPIFPHEVIFGKEDWTHGNSHQQHRGWFTPDLLRGVVLGAGFEPRWSSANDNNLMCVAVRPCRV